MSESTTTTTTTTTTTNTLFSRIPTLSNFHLSLLINANLTLSTLLRTPMPRLDALLNDALEEMKKQRAEEECSMRGDDRFMHHDTHAQIHQRRNEAGGAGSSQSQSSSTNLAHHDEPLPQSISRSHIQTIIKLVCRHLRVKVQRNIGQKLVDESYVQREEIAFRTSLPALDSLLGGIMNGILTELVGPAGVGKSQWSITMAIEKLAHMDIVRRELREEGVHQEVEETPSSQQDTTPEAILYIDTEGIDIFPRMQQVASNRFPSAKLKKALLKHLNQIHILRFSSSNEMSQFFKEELENYLLENHVTLILLDSIAYLIRKEFAGTTKLWERQNVLLEYATKLKELSSSLRIPVIITNHVVQGESTSFAFNSGSVEKRKTSGGGGNAPSLRVHTSRENQHSQNHQQHHDCTSMEEDSPSDAVTTISSSSNNLKAALGNTWAHCVNTRLILQEPTSGCKQVIIDKSISSGREMVGYVITSGGVHQDPNWHRTMQAGAHLNQIQSRMGIFQGQEPPSKRRRVE